MVDVLSCFVFGCGKSQQDPNDNNWVSMRCRQKMTVVDVKSENRWKKLHDTYLTLLQKALQSCLAVATFVCIFPQPCTAGEKHDPKSLIRALVFAGGLNVITVRRLGSMSSLTRY